MAAQEGAMENTLNVRPGSYSVLVYLAMCVYVCVLIVESSSCGETTGPGFRPVSLIKCLSMHAVT